MKRRTLTTHQRAQMRSLMEDSGYGARDARELALSGFGELTPEEIEDYERAKAEDEYEAWRTSEPTPRGKWGAEEP